MLPNIYQSFPCFDALFLDFLKQPVQFFENVSSSLTLKIYVGSVNYQYYVLILFRKQNL